MLEDWTVYRSLGAAVVAAMLFKIITGIRRVYFSPLSHIPGPKLAALTYFYQFYFDVYQYKGRWLWQQVELHKRYGPVVRVGPDEVHINNPDFYAEMAGTSVKRRHKSATWYWFSGMNHLMGQASFGTLDHSHHAMRRGAMNGFFSKRKVQELEDRIKGHVQNTTQRLLECAKTGEIMNLLHLASGLTFDVITSYSFGHCMNTLDAPDLGEPLRRQLEEGVQLHPVARRFRSIIRLLLNIVTYTSRKFGWPKDGPVEFANLIHDLTEPAYTKAMKEGEIGQNAIETSIVQAMAHSKALPLEEKTRMRIECEAATLIGAGTETTARTLAAGIFHVLNDPAIQARVLAELRTIMPRSDSPLPSVAELTQLPYLTACIHESIRIAHGVAGRLVRISPDADLVCDGVSIPKGSTFSMSHYIQHTDPRLFPDPFAFRPERFLGEKGLQTLRYLVAFGKGPRNCLGMNLAWSELYLAFAGMLGSVDMQLYKTTEKDVQIEREYFIGLFSEDSQGIRVKVNGLQK